MYTSCATPPEKHTANTGKNIQKQEYLKKKGSTFFLEYEAYKKNDSITISFLNPKEKTINFRIYPRRKNNKIGQKNDKTITATFHANEILHLSQPAKSGYGYYGNFSEKNDYITFKTK